MFYRYMARVQFLTIKKIPTHKVFLKEKVQVSFLLNKNIEKVHKLKLFYR